MLSKTARKTVIAMGLAMAAGSAMAAQGSMGTDAGASAWVGGASAQAGMSSSSSLGAMFNKLDTNHNGVLSRSEASANPKIRSLYSSLDTSSTIQNKAKNAKAGGITKDQFEAGMQAAMKGGVVGPAVSGGGTYTEMKNGMKKKMSGMQNDKSDAMSSMNNDMSGKMSDMHNKMESSGSAMENSGQSMNNDANGEMQSGQSQLNAAGQTMQRGNDAAVGAGARDQTGATTNQN